jgi:hypothetical protein
VDTEYIEDSAYDRALVRGIEAEILSLAAQAHRLGYTLQIRYRCGQVTVNAQSIAQKIGSEESWASNVWLKP